MAQFGLCVVSLVSKPLRLPVAIIVQLRRVGAGL